MKNNTTLTTTPIGKRDELGRRRMRPGFTGLGDTGDIVSAARAHPHFAGTSPARAKKNHRPGAFG